MNDEGTDQPCIPVRVAAADAVLATLATVRKERDYAHTLLRRIRQDIDLPAELLHAVNAAVALESEGDIAEAERGAACRSGELDTAGQATFY